MIVKVGIFTRLTKDKMGYLFNAYTRYYLPTWEGCCEHAVEVPFRSLAKARALEVHKRDCLGIVRKEAP